MKSMSSVRAGVTQGKAEVAQLHAAMLGAIHEVDEAASDAVQFMRNLNTLKADPRFFYPANTPKNQVATSRWSLGAYG